MQFFLHQLPGGFAVVTLAPLQVPVIERYWLPNYEGLSGECGLSPGTGSMWCISGLQVFASWIPETAGDYPVVIAGYLKIILGLMLAQHGCALLGKSIPITSYDTPFWGT